MKNIKHSYTDQRCSCSYWYRYDVISDNGKQKECQCRYCDFIWVIKY